MSDRGTAWGFFVAASLLVSGIPLAHAAACADPEAYVLDGAVYDTTYGTCAYPVLQDYCDGGGDLCPTWAEVTAEHADDTSWVELTECGPGSDLGSRAVLHYSEWITTMDFTAAGDPQRIEVLALDTTLYCCEGVESSAVQYGSGGDVCTPAEADTAGAETGTSDTGKGSPTGCGCASGGASGAGGLLGLLLLSTAARRPRRHGRPPS